MNTRKGILVWLRSKGNYALLLAFSAVLTFNVHGELIPADRRIDWNPGIPGGIPFRSVTNVVATHQPYGATGNGMTDDTAALQYAINACASGQVIYIPSGTYRVSRALSVTNKYITIRGDGPGKTIIDSVCSNQVAVFAFGPVKYIHQGPFADVRDGATKGSTNVVVSGTSGIVVGGYMAFDQTNDPSFVTHIGSSGAATWVSRSNGRRAMGQIVEVTEVTSNRVTFHPPLYWTYSAALGPQVCPFSGGNKYTGIENLTVRGNETGSKQHFRMEGASYCWLKNVESDYVDGDHVNILNSFRCEVRDSYFHDAFHHTSGQTDADLMLAEKTTACLIENNIFWRLHVSIMLNWGAAGNVIAYNYCNNLFDQFSSNAVMSDMSVHGAHPMFNLWEGNAAVKFCPDSTWGSSSHGTVFRNVFSGTTHVTPPLSGRSALSTNSWLAFQMARPMQIERDSRYYNIIGNVLGGPAFTNLAYPAKYMVVPPAAARYETPYIFQIGYANIGDTNVSPLTFNTTLIHANWDCVDRTQRVELSYSTNLAASLYYNEKPGWFGDCPWPPFDPLQPEKAVATNLPAGRRFFSMRPDAFNLPIFQSSRATPMESVVVCDGRGSNVDYLGKPLPVAGAIGFGRYTYEVATKVKVSADFVAKKVVCRLSRLGRPAFNIRCSVYAQASLTNAPGTLIGRGSDPVAAASIETNVCDVAFTNMYAELTAGSTVWFVLTASALSYPDYVNWEQVACAYDANGIVMDNRGSGTKWTPCVYSWVSVFTPFGEPQEAKPMPPTSLKALSGQ